MKNTFLAIIIVIGVIFLIYAVSDRNTEYFSQNPIASYSHLYPGNFYYNGLMDRSRILNPVTTNSVSVYQNTPSIDNIYLNRPIESVSVYQSEPLDSVPIYQNQGLPILNPTFGTNIRYMPGYRDYWYLGN